GSPRSEPRGVRTMASRVEGLPARELSVRPGCPSFIFDGLVLDHLVRRRLLPRLPRAQLPQPFELFGGEDLFECRLFIPLKAPDLPLQLGNLPAVLRPDPVDSLLLIVP